MIDNSNRNNTDAPALAAATVAGAVGVFVSPGPYGFLSMVVGFVMLFLVLGYSGTHERNKIQSLAFSSVVGFATILVAGCILEYCLVCISPDESISCILEFSQREQPSKISDFLVGIIWVVATAFTYPIDRIMQARARKLHKSVSG